MRIGGVMFRPTPACLALRGRPIEISATGQREVMFDLPDFYHNESRLFGVDTLKLDLTSGRCYGRLPHGQTLGQSDSCPRI
jgi:NADPH2:quinone reductase